MMDFGFVHLVLFHSTNENEQLLYIGWTVINELVIKKGKNVYWLYDTKEMTKRTRSIKREVKEDGAK